jgi:hypothetical protein
MRDGVPVSHSNIPQTSQIQGSEPSERKRGIRRGAKLLFFSMVLFIPMFAWAVAEEHPGPLLLPATLFLTGVFWMLYYRLFGDEHAPAPRQTQPVYFGPPPQQAYFPQQQSVPAYRAPVEPPQERSVIENTTRSLERK